LNFANLFFIWMQRLIWHSLYRDIRKRFQVLFEQCFLFRRHIHHLWCCFRSSNWNHWRLVVSEIFRLFASLLQELLEFLGVEFGASLSKFIDDYHGLIVFVDFSVDRVVFLAPLALLLELSSLNIILVHHHHHLGLDLQVDRTIELVLPMLHNAVKELFARVFAVHENLCQLLLPL
jgi:hypothetical protein